MTDDEFAALIDIGAEQRNVEFKGPGPITDKHLVSRIARAILGMTNRLDGGYVVVGVNEAKGVLTPDGFIAPEIVEWTRDSLADKVAPMADPSVDFELEHRTYQGRLFVLITVREFDETPVFCRVSKHDPSGKKEVLREGALYVRGRRKPETIEIRTSQEMRDLLDLALRKRLRQFTELLQMAGLGGQLSHQPSDASRFEGQLADLGL